MTTPPWTEPVAAALEPCFPERFEGLLNPCLKAPIEHSGYPQGPEFAPVVGLGNVHPSDGVGAPGLGRAQEVHESPPRCRCFDHQFVHARRVPAFVHLRHLAHTHQSVRVAPQHEFLQGVRLLQVARLGCPEDPLPQIADKPVGFAPVDA